MLIVVSYKVFCRSCEDREILTTRLLGPNIIQMGAVQTFRSAIGTVLGYYQGRNVLLLQRLVENWDLLY